MNKIYIFKGSTNAFELKIPEEHKTLSKLAYENDAERRVLHIAKEPDKGEKEAKEKVKIDNLVIYADDYASVQEHVLTNFISYISNFDIKNIYIQNPPIVLLKQIKRVFDEKNVVEEDSQEYRMVTSEIIRKIYNEFDNVIIGQRKVKDKLLRSVYRVMNNAQEKPVVMLFYGESGLGKTETAKFLANVIGGKLLRKQLSMYQNQEFANYLFGGKLSEKSFAKDLLARDSNIILLDEFDKANSMFHSAFYQIFDEGIYEDQNYKVDVKHAIIICTSNYCSEEEIIEKLGRAIYNRFDSIIEFSPLAEEDKKLIIEREFEGLDDVSYIKYKESMLSKLSLIKNVREIKRLVKDIQSTVKLKEICNIK